MKRLHWVLLALLAAAAGVQAQEKTTYIAGLKFPESVAVGLGGKVFVSQMGKPGEPGDGNIARIDGGKIEEFVTGLDDPKGLVSFQKWLFVTDTTKVLKIDDQGKVEVVAGPDAFPIKPMFLNDIAVDEKGVLYVSDSGDRKGNGGAVFRIDPKGNITTVVSQKTHPQLHTPNGLILDGVSHLLLADFGSGQVHRVRIFDGQMTKLMDGFEGADGFAWDHFGKLFISSWKQGKVWVVARPGEKAELVLEGLESAADLCLDPTGKFMLIPDMKAGKVYSIPAAVPSQPVDLSPLAIGTEVAFPELEWAGWKGVTDEGKFLPLRPILLTHAGDGSNRCFVPIQQGTIHVFPNEPKAKKTQLFLDISSKVKYSDKENEEGLLGLAFHPDYKKNGEFFVFYTVNDAKLTNVLSRFKVSKDDPNRADPASEEELLRIERPFWNHDGGTIAFGSDGYLYVAVGDGGSANDPHKNGQKLSTLLGKILRIDVNTTAGKKKYGIPKDNPFVDMPDAMPEIYAYGFRNVWRFTFDRKTQRMWAADVGQNLYEEINHVVKGGNYGWSKREGLHPFSDEGVDVTPGLIEPIWEYHHDIGRSITGGVVYRGPGVPELDGLYLYADYISNRIWALRYDDAKKRVVANHPIPHPNQPILSFGEDQAGEVYFVTTSLTGNGIYRFKKK